MWLSTASDPVISCFYRCFKFLVSYSSSPLSLPVGWWKHTHSALMPAVAQTFFKNRTWQFLANRTPANAQYTVSQLTAMWAVKRIPAILIINQLLTFARVENSLNSLAFFRRDISACQKGKGQIFLNAFPWSSAARRRGSPQINRWINNWRSAANRCDRASRQSQLKLARKWPCLFFSRL